MDFPDELDIEDMELAMKEWELTGWVVEKNRGGQTGPWPLPLDIVYVREDHNRHQMLARYVYLGDNGWRKTWYGVA